MSNTLDPAYAAAAARRAGRPPRALDRIALAGGCLLAGFILVLGFLDTHRAAPEVAKVHARLVARVRDAETNDKGLATTVQSLTRQIDSLRNGALASSGPLRAELQREQEQAGAIAVRGPGLQVQLDNAAPATVQPSSGRAAITSVATPGLLSDRDLRSVVNELWSDGAEAIAVNGIRLTPTSAIRFAGQAVLVDQQPITSPYVIRAIGSPATLDTGFASSAVASRYQTLVSAEGIRFSFGQLGSVTLPAAPVADPLYARALTTSNSGAGSSSNSKAQPTVSISPTDGTTR